MDHDDVDLESRSACAASIMRGDSCDLFSVIQKSAEQDVDVGVGVGPRCCPHFLSLAYHKTSEQDRDSGAC